MFKSFHFFLLTYLIEKNICNCLASLLTGCSKLAMTWLPKSSWVLRLPQSNLGRIHEMCQQERTYCNTRTVKSTLIPYKSSLHFQETRSERLLKRHLIIKLKYLVNTQVSYVSHAQVCTEWASLKPDLTCSSEQTSLSSFLVFLVVFTNSTCLSLKSLHPELGNWK